MKNYTIGIIGYGGFGHFLHNAWSSLDQVTVYAVADVNPAQDPGEGIKFYAHWQDLIRDPNIEFISIATPPSTHAEISCSAMEKGKHVLIEKPLATTIEDAKHIINIRNSTGQIALIDYMLRFNPLIETINSLTHAGRFGKLQRIAVENYAQDESLPPEHWFWDHTISGGIMVEHAVHFIDLANSLTTSIPRKVNGISHWRNNHQQDQVLATVVYENGLMATHYHAFTRPGFFENTSIRLVYDLAQIELEGWIPISGHITALVNPQSEKELKRFPNFRIRQKTKITDAEDVSRPKGWGINTPDSHPNKETIVSGGRVYNVNTMISGSFALSDNKAEVYASSLRALLKDFIMAVENPKHVPRVSLEDGLSSLEIALLAKEAAKEPNLHFS